MSTTTRRLALLACLGATTLVAAACENAEARQRAEVQAMIIAASQKLGPITTASREEQVKQELRGLIGKLDRTTGASPDQQAVAVRLASNAHRKLAGIALDEAKRLEADHRSTRVVLHGMIDSTPSGSTRRLASGGNQRVLDGSTTMAGPSSNVSTARPARSRQGTARGWFSSGRKTGTCRGGCTASGRARVGMRSGDSTRRVLRSAVTSRGTLGSGGSP